MYSIMYGEVIYPVAVMKLTRCNEQQFYGY